MNFYQAIAAISLLSVACAPALRSDETPPAERIAKTIQSMNTELDHRIAAAGPLIVILYTDLTNPAWLQKALHLDAYFSVAYINASHFLEQPNALDRLHASICSNQNTPATRLLLGSSREAQALASSYLSEFHEAATELPLPADHEDLSLLLSLTDALLSCHQTLATVSDSDAAVFKSPISTFHSLFQTH